MAQVRETLHLLTEKRAWDHLKARDVPPEIIELVEERIVAGDQPRKICVMLGLNRHGGVHSSAWKKIQANLRGGFRADAEAFVLRQTTQLFGVIQKLKETVDDAFDEGVPIVGFDKFGQAHVTHVKGATKELGSIIESYAKAVAAPVKLWKELGAVGEKSGGVPGQTGTTIIVKTAVNLPSQEDIAKYRERYSELPAIEVKKDPSVK